MADLISPAAQSYAEQHTTSPVGALADVAAWTAASTPAPQMNSGVPEARLLEALIVAGGAREVLEAIARLEGPFDLVYIDAWKSDYPRYYELVVDKLAPRGVIVADNLFRGGQALDPAADDDQSAGIREFARRVQADPRVTNVLLTVGDGLMLAWRTPAAAAAD